MKNKINELKSIGFEIIHLANKLKIIKNIKPIINYEKLNILILLNYRDKMTISEIQRVLGISYKETYRHIKELISLNVLTRIEKKYQKHNPVYIKIKNKKL